MLCLRLLYEPCTLRCGHSFCVRCCRDLAKARHAKCPTCRRVLPVHGQPTDMAVSLSLAQLLAEAFPEEYAARKTEDATDADPCPSDNSQSGSIANSSARSGADDTDESETTLPLFYLDSMLPRQRMSLNIFEPRYRLMVRRCLEGSRRFGMVGVEWLTPLRHMGQRGVRHGVEVEIVENSPQPDGRFHIAVVAGRRFEIVDGTWEQDGYAMATVRWILPPSRSTTSPDVPAEPATAGADVTEVGATPPGPASGPGATPPDEAESDSDRTHHATAADSTSASTNASLAMAAALEPLVEEWKELVTTGRWERFRGQLGRSLADLGPMPAASDLDGVVERSLWVGALINPLPGLGVAMEVRPLLLAAGSNAHEMVQIATEGIRGSIAHMTPSPAALWVRRQLARLDWSSGRDTAGNPLVGLDWLWRFLSVALTSAVFGTFVLVCLGIHRGFSYLLEAQHITDAAESERPVDLTHYTTRNPPPPAPPPSIRDEV